ncbi:uncharacterized protein EI97DRAFT_385672 [Westerdykella ornata]|uniref:STEEP1 domain-containing protein n=1 Tax=Westerdykella ornata TaxID=318751 RepID=A0A6A6J7D1_WESOR|nr:uncharacterized protein EI97DRAFT_385672 [Westerdykella ornata]KAF2272481.1 hypothetical protein EI97DRAFT_385672 [Westerdykella ornata]
MDIGTHRPSLERVTTDEKLSLAASNTVYTYHCLCTHLLLATSTPLAELPTRTKSLDRAHIMPLPPAPAPTSRQAQSTTSADHYGCIISMNLDQDPTIVQSDAGFEKRYLQRCGRCNQIVAYHLDWQQYPGATDGQGHNRFGRREDVVYLVPGGFVSTSEMLRGKMPSGVAVSELKL